MNVKFLSFVIVIVLLQSCGSSLSENSDKNIAKRDSFEGTLAMAIESPDKIEVAILIYKLEDV